MQHADRTVERFAIDRQARMTAIHKNRKHIIAKSRQINGADIGARHHHIVNTHIAEAQQIAEHVAFFQRKLGAFFFRLVQRVFNAFAQIRLGHTAHPPPQAG